MLSGSKKKIRHKMSMQRTLTTNGLPVAIVGNTVQTATPVRAGTTIVTSGTNSASSRDLWNAYAFNTSAEYVTLHIEIGSPHCTLAVIIPPVGNGGVTRVLTNLPLPRNTSIRGWATTGNVVYMYGFASSSSVSD